MNTPSFTRVLQFTRILAVIYFVVSCGGVFALIGQTVEVAQEPQVQLTLQTQHRALLATWDAVQAGWEAGSTTPARPRLRQLAAVPLAAGPAFELTSSPEASVLRYREPSAWRRVALLWLGASARGLSVAELLFWLGGSWLLLQLLYGVTPEAPFTPANARRLQQLTLLLFILNLWQYGAQLSMVALVPAYRVAQVAAPLNQYISLSTEGLIPGFQVGYILLVIAVVYRRGVELSQEAEFVI